MTYEAKYLGRIAPAICVLLFYQAFHPAPTGQPETATVVRSRVLQLYREARRRWNNIRSSSTLSPQQRAHLKGLITEVEKEIQPFAEDEASGTPADPTDHNRLLALEERIRSVFFSTYASPGREIRTIWYFRAGCSDWDQVCKELSDAGFNSITLRVARGGNAIYPSQYLPMDPWARGLDHDELAQAVEAAHRYGLRLIAWKVNFHAGSAPPEFFEQLKQEDRLVRDPEGRQGVFLNPADPRNTELDLNIARELVEKYAIDGYQFDYIRYPDEPPIGRKDLSPYDFDYGPISRREFEKSLEHSIENWPADVISGELKLRYEEWERQQIDTHVERIYHAIKSIKPNVEVSASVWVNPGYFGAIIKQDWRRWIDNKTLDVVVPMDYTSDPEVLRQRLWKQMEIVRNRIPLVAGLGTYLVKSPAEVLQQIEIARKSGAQGFSYFSWFTPHRAEDFKAMKLGATFVRASDRVHLTRRKKSKFRRKPRWTLNHTAVAAVMNSSQRARIGVWEDGLGGANIRAALKQSGFNVKVISELRKNELSQCELLVVPQVNDYAQLMDENVHDIREWVQAGGRILLTRDAVGVYWHPRMFPQVGVGSARTTHRTVICTASDSPIKTFTHSSVSHVMIRPSNGANVLAWDNNGSAVIVEGKAGRGHVVMCGIALGGPDDQPMNEPERLLLRWLILRA